jgi:predicted MFS family arabinose efflux permease
MPARKDKDEKELLPSIGGLLLDRLRKMQTSHHVVALTISGFAAMLATRTSEAIYLISVDLWMAFLVTSPAAQPESRAIKKR